MISARFRKAVGARGLELDVVVFLCINVHGNATRVGTASVCGRTDDATGPLQHQVDNHSITHDKGRNLTVITTAVIVVDKEFYAYVYRFYTTIKVPSTLADVSSAFFYAWDSKIMTHTQPAFLRPGPQQRV